MVIDLIFMTEVFLSFAEGKKFKPKEKRKYNIICWKLETLEKNMNIEDYQKKRDFLSRDFNFIN